MKCNGKACKFTYEKLYICECDFNPHTLRLTPNPANAANHPNNHSHVVSPSLGGMSAIDLSGSTTFNCSTAPAGALWTPTVRLTASAQGGQMYPVVICRTYFWDAVIVVKVEIGNVVRGTDLPFSLPPGGQTDVNVTIAPSLAGSGHSFTFDVINCSADNGTATVVGNSIRTSDGTIRLQGLQQTEEGHAGSLEIRARFDGTTECAVSSGFSVCAHPLEVRFTYTGIDSPIVRNGKEYWGASYNLELVAGDGQGLLDCDKTKMAENIDIVSRTGLWVGIPLFESGVFHATLAGNLDHHITGGAATAAEEKTLMDAAGFDGYCIVDQYFRYSCSRCGIAENLTGGPMVPTSGFRITKTMSKDAAGKYWFHVKKEGKANNDVSAGTVDDTTVKDSEVKD